MEKEIEKELKIIGNNIRAKRETLKLEPKAVAHQMDLTPQAYGNIENGKTNIQFGHIYHLAKIFKIDYSEILNIKRQINICNTANNTTDNYYVLNNDEMFVQTDKEKLEAHDTAIKEMRGEIKLLKGKQK
jgi:transcriptional regulator with XRE-family HTH domain